MQISSSNLSQPPGGAPVGGVTLVLAVLWVRDTTDMEGALQCRVGRIGRRGAGEGPGWLCPGRGGSNISMHGVLGGGWTHGAVGGAPACCH